MEGKGSDHQSESTNPNASAEKTNKMDNNTIDSQNQDLNVTAGAGSLKSRYFSKGRPST